jgi:hypothetical protein
MESVYTRDGQVMTKKYLYKQTILPPATTENYFTIAEAVKSVGVYIGNMGALGYLVAQRYAETFKRSPRQARPSQEKYCSIGHSKLNVYTSDEYTFVVNCIREYLSTTY